MRQPFSRATSRYCPDESRLRSNGTSASSSGAGACRTRWTVSSSMAMIVGGCSEYPRRTSSMAWGGRRERTEHPVLPEDGMCGGGAGRGVEIRALAPGGEAAPPCRPERGRRGSQAPTASRCSRSPLEAEITHRDQFRRRAGGRRRRRPGAQHAGRRGSPSASTASAPRSAAAGNAGPSRRGGDGSAAVSRPRS